MTSFELVLDKIPAKLCLDGHVSYHLTSLEHPICLNDYIGHQIDIQFDGTLICMDCQKQVKKFYSPGLCYVCTMNSSMNSPCIINPELCEAHTGGGRDPEWEKTHHLKPHFVYLANSGGLKVGVTRADQVPTRWIDQGADQAIIIAHTPFRKLAGDIEVILKNHFSDKTNWRAMLKNVVDTSVDLSLAKKQALSMLPEALIEYTNTDDKIHNLIYPTQVLTKSVQSIKLDKVNNISGNLTGIKAQYLIFDHQNVINIRTHSGYKVLLTIHS